MRPIKYTKHMLIKSKDIVMTSTNLSLGSAVLSFCAFLTSVSTCFNDLLIWLMFFWTFSSATEPHNNKQRQNQVTHHYITSSSHTHTQTHLDTLLARCAVVLETGHPTPPDRKMWKNSLQPIHRQSVFSAVFHSSDIGLEADALAQGCMALSQLCLVSLMPRLASVSNQMPWSRPHCDKVLSQQVFAKCHKHLYDVQRWTTELNHFWLTEYFAVPYCLMAEMIMIPFCAGNGDISSSCQHWGNCFSLGHCLCFKKCLDYITGSW